MPTQLYVFLSAILFSIGGVGFLVRRNVLVTLMSIEIMLNAVNLALVAFNRDRFGDHVGQMFAFFLIAAEAAEVAVGLAGARPRLRRPHRRPVCRRCLVALRRRALGSTTAKSRSFLGILWCAGFRAPRPRRLHRRAPSDGRHLRGAHLSLRSRASRVAPRWPTPASLATSCR